MNYDDKNELLIIFGGGGYDKVKFGDVHFLDWKNKTWRKSKHNSQITHLSLERTYHTA